ncbi:MAG TPA: regulatory iron-sulfur-containing complex subunit RicT [Bacilli bacterium]|nr:regulatory iron-sulfur-containing complex subunit RicT [Bacilli bacterium]
MTVDYYISVAFLEGGKPYYFKTNDPTLNVGDYVIVETVQGIEIAKIVAPPIPSTAFTHQLEVKPIMHRASEYEIKQGDVNKEDARLALEFCIDQAAKLNLKMTLLRAEYTFDRSKILFTYVAEKRVDFRELVRILAAKLRTRVELRQIGSRDRAKIIGGLGACGFPLCCHTFLKEFEGISIARAKNQMLTLNIPKLSGQCGKLLCCLKFEDDYYTETKKDFPIIGSKYRRDKITHYVNSFNVINRTVRLDYDGGFVIVPLDELSKGYRRIREKK